MAGLEWFEEEFEDQKKKSKGKRKEEELEEDEFDDDDFDDDRDDFYDDDDDEDFEEDEDDSEEDEGEEDEDDDDDETGTQSQQAPQQPVLKKSKVIKPVGLPKYQEEMWDVIDAFEDRAWSNAATGIPTGFKDLDKALDGGWQTGWILVGGDSNIGKTSFLSQLAWQAAHVNQDVYCLDFSLDDPMHDKIPRVVASNNKVLINAVKNPNGYSHLPKMLQRRTDGLNKLRKAIDRYRCYDANHSTDIDKIEDTIKQTLVDLETEAKQNGTKAKRLITFIDNFHDLSTSAREAQGGDKQKYDYLAQRVSDLATKYDICVVTTGEFKKLNGFRRPGLDDLRESVKIKYEAKAVLLCYNEVGLKGEGASIYFEQQGESTKKPVFEVKFGKNKMGSFKGRLFFEFYPEIAYFESADAQSTKRYNNLIYSNE
jgi:replicative DNA helicase